MAAVQFYVPYDIMVKPGNLGTPNGTVYFYLTGGLTLTPAYASSSLTTQLSNPVVADGAGRLPAIYLDNALSYRVRAFDKDGALLLDRDPYIPGTAPDSSALSPYQAACAASASASAGSATSSATSATAAATSATASANSATAAAASASSAAATVASATAAAIASASGFAASASASATAADTSATNAAASAAEADVAKDAAQLALALGKGDPGGNAMAVGTFTSLTGMSIAVGQNSIETTGYAADGDGGRARYIYDASVDTTYVTAHPGAAARTTNGRGYRLDERRPIPHMFTGGGSTGFLNAQSWADFKSLKMPFLYSVTEALAPGSWSLPGDFNDQLKVGKVVYDGVNWNVENDPIAKIDCTRVPLTYTTYYLSYASGADTNNGTSSGTPFKTWSKLNAVIGALTAGSNVLVLLLDQHVAYLSIFGSTNGFSGRNVVVQSAHASGFTRFVQMREDKTQASFAWVAHGSNGAWKAPAASFSGAGFSNGNFPAQFWLGRTDPDGFPIPVVSTGQTSSTVDTTELTSTWDSSYLYVHLPDGAKPDPFNNWIYSNSTVFTVNLDAGDVVFRNCRFFNGSQGTTTNAFKCRTTSDSVTVGAARLGFDGCYFYGASANGMGIYDCAVIVAKNCKSAYCVNDLFNVHSNNLSVSLGSYMTYYELNCTGHHAGYSGFAFGGTSANGVSCNGSTGHDAISCLLVGSRFRQINHGSPVCYVLGTDVQIFGVQAPVAEDAGNETLAYPSAFSYDCNTTEGSVGKRRMRLVGCKGGADANSAAIQIAGTATDALITVEKWQGDPHARLFAKRVNNGSAAGGSIQDTNGNVLFKAA